jgi:biopolymer transport protein TolR
MRRRILEANSEASPEINLVPLIDVCLVLVVILLIATPLAFEASIGVRQSAASAKKAAIPLHEERVEVRILDERMVHVNRIPVARENLADTLRPLLASSSLRKVVIRPEPTVSHGTFVNVLDQAKEAGAAEIAVVGS